jgi:hypothetical protein
MELQVDAKPVNSSLFALVQARSMYVCTTDDGRAVAHMLLHVAMKAGRNVKALTKAVVTFALRTSMLSDTGPPACPGALHPQRHACACVRVRRSPRCARQHTEA